MFRLVQPFGIGSKGGGAAAPAWYADALVAYQPKGAASLAASYTNLGSGGATYNAAPGVAPTLSSGWVFNGTTQYLTTSLYFSASLDYSFFVQYSGASIASNNVILGGQVSIGSQGAVDITLTTSDAVSIRAGHPGGAADNAPALLAGNYGIAGRTGYRNGVADASLIFNLGGSGSEIGFIGAKSLNGTAEAFFTGTVIAVAIFNRILSAGEAATLATAMAAL